MQVHISIACHVNPREKKNEREKQRNENGHVCEKTKPLHILHEACVCLKKCLLDHFPESTAKGSTAVVFCSWQALLGNVLQERQRGGSDKLHNTQTLAADSN